MDFGQKLATNRAAAVADALRILHLNGCVPNYEHILSNTYRRVIRPGQTVLDIGAHAALHLRHFLNLVGDSGFVAAFEPIPVMAERLVEQFGGVHNVEIHQVALSNYTGEANFNFVENAAEMSGLRQREYFMDAPQISTIKVAIDQLDNLTDKFQKVDYIKIDVEGGEIDCLAGGKERFFKKHRPIISVEYGQPSYAAYDNSAYTLYDLATELGYELADIFGNVVVNRQMWGYICDRSAWDFFMVPSERVQEWVDTMLADE
ncbi:FkbM family methyltransferase [Caulobacter radicis]|uniref:FkbM family methyltransferase n=1 Tax=Caulobacter radicis TaxID=2172650 RepID=UPI001403B999|nr:FkbM family methyltransferase [Caulobacter radicis]